MESVKSMESMESISGICLGGGMGAILLKRWRHSDKSIKSTLRYLTTHLTFLYLGVLVHY